MTASNPIIDLPFVGDPELLAAMKRRLVLWHGENYNDLSTGLCFWFALALHIEAKRVGRKLMLQAGTAEWRRVRPEEDDGKIATHYGYVFEEDAPYTQAFVRRLKDSGEGMEILPEIHIWLVDLDKKALVDPTAGCFPAQAKKFGGFEWTGPVPPETLWCPIDSLPDDGTLIYKANRVACSLLIPLVKNQFLPSGGRKL